MGNLENPRLADTTRPPIRLKQLFGIDLRALAAFRIGLAVLLLIDVYLRFTVLTAHHTDWGVLPRSVLLESSRTSVLSLYMINGSAPFAGFLLALTAAFAAMLLVGYKTRIVTFLCWVLIVSVQRRTFITLNSGDTLFALLFFWSLFLPLGATASVDSRARKPDEPPPPTLICNPATAAILLQIVYVYVLSALFKNHPIWRTEGSAIYYSLNIDRLVSVFGLILRDHYELTKAMTFGTLYFEFVGPFIAFIPIGFKYLRTLTALAFIGFHLGLAVTFHLVLFPYICIVAWLLYLPTEFWDALPRLRTARALHAAGSATLRAISSAIQRATRGARLFAPSPPSWRLGLVEQVIVSLLLIYVFFWNVGGYRPAFMVPKPLKPLANVLWISQKWSMFAPYPMKDDGWIIAPAILADGSEIDLRTGLPPTFEKPTLHATTYESPRWRKFDENIWRGNHRPKVVFYANWLRRRWNNQHDNDSHIKAMQIYHIVEYTRPYPEPPYLSPPQLMYEWEGPATGHWIAHKQNEQDFHPRMRKEIKKRMQKKYLHVLDKTDPQNQ